MDVNKRTKLKHLKKHLENCIRRTGFDGNFVGAVKFHMDLILKSEFEKLQFKSKMEFCNILMSKLFIDKMEDLFPKTRFSCQVNENSEWPLPLLPSEVFGGTKLPDVHRKHLFYTCLEVGDILDCRVASVSSSEYHLRVIHKYGIARILDDLNLIVVMRRNKTELKILENDLFTRELIRVVVFEIKKSNDEVYVTLDDNSVEFRKCKAKLGRISEKQVPSYVLDPPDPEPCSSYSDYLNSLPAFRNPILLNSVFAGFGIDPKKMYTFYPTFKDYKCDEVFTGQTLLKNSKIRDIENYSSLSQELKKKNIPKSLHAIEMSIQMAKALEFEKPEKYALLSKLRNLRGEIHLVAENPNISSKALHDFKYAHHADRSNELPKKNLAALLFRPANRAYKAKQYKKAVQVLELVLEYDENHAKALELLDHLKNKHPEAFVNLDEESLYTLQEKKKELVNQLKKFSTIEQNKKTFENSNFLGREEKRK